VSTPDSGADPSQAVAWDDAKRMYSAWLEERERTTSTAETYLPELDRFARWHLSRYQASPTPDALTGASLRAWKEDLLAQDLRPATVNKKLSALFSFSSWMAGEGLGRRVERPVQVRQQPPAVRWLDVNQEHSLLRAVEAGGNQKDAAAVHLLLNTGMREFELSGLRWKQITISERKGSVRIVGKRGKERTVSLNLKARQALETLRLISPGWHKANAWVLPGKDETAPITRKTVWAIVKRYAHPSKIPGLSPHVLRHTFCRRLIEAGVSPLDVATLAGHTKLDTTRRYVLSGEEDLRRAVEALPGGSGNDEPAVTPRAKTGLGQGRRAPRIQRPDTLQ
jgi:site-specific recombinase XerD